MATTSEETADNVAIEKRLGRIEQQLEGVAAMADVQPNGPFAYSSQADTDEIDLRELWNVIWKGKWVIVAVTFVFALAAVVYALSLPNVYKSEALLVPAEENSGGGLAGLAGQFGGLASLAGVDIGGRGSDKTTIAIEVLKSREFISSFIQRHDLLIPLMAAEGWDLGQDKLIIDEGIYDEVKSKWMRDPKPPRGAEPSSLEAYRAFRRLFDVTTDKETGLITLSVEHYSPTIAKAWVDMLVLDINAEIRRRDVAEASESVQYLSNQLAKISIADMRAVFFELIEEQTKTVMFAEVREEYVFKTIDRAVEPEIKSKPKRGLICIVSVMIGGLISILIVLARNFMLKTKKNYRRID